MAGRFILLGTNSLEWVSALGPKRGGSQMSIKITLWVSKLAGSLLYADFSRQICATYPARLVVPAKISDSTLTYGAKYRSKGRIPALVYLHWNNHVRPKNPAHLPP